MPNQQDAERTELILRATEHLTTEQLRGGVVSREVADRLAARVRESMKWMIGFPTHLQLEAALIEYMRDTNSRLET